jgi:hypothetical protein
MLKIFHKITSSLIFTSLVAGCGGGGGEGEDEYYVFDISAYDDYSTSTEKYTPSAEQFSFFPLALHFKTINKSYVSKVGTTSTRNYTISGRMTTPTVNSGTYAAKLTTKVNYKSSALFEGISVTPITYESLRYEIKLNGTSQTNENSFSTSYFDTSFGIRIGSLGSTTYKKLDGTLSSPLPEAVVAGQKGNFLTYLVYSDSTKSTLIGRDVLSYNILSTSLGPTGDYLARVEYITSSYSTQNQLLSIQTSTDDIVYSTKNGAATKNISLYFDDIVGTTTSRLLITRLP